MFDRIAGIVTMTVDILAGIIVTTAVVLAFWAAFGDEPEWLDRPTDPFAKAVEYMP